jgi:hypothetical protein
MGEKALLRACREMRDANAREEWDDAEINGTPAQYWLGDRRVSAVTVDMGLWMLLFSSDGLGTEYERHTLNERGREFAETGVIPSIALPRTIGADQ